MVAGLLFIITINYKNTGIDVCIMDGLVALAHELRKWHNFHILYNHIDRILMKQGIIEKKAYAECRYLNRKKPDCVFVCFVKAENNKLGENITIMVKSDHNPHRRLRVAIQVGKKLFQECEDDDKPKWSDKKVFRKEFRHIEKDIDKYFKKVA